MLTRLLKLTLVTLLLAGCGVENFSGGRIEIHGSAVARSTQR